MAVTNSNPKLANRHHLLLGVVSVLLEVPPDHMHVTGEGLEVVHRLLGTKIASAEDVLDPAGYQQLLELCWEGRGPVGDVKIT